MNALFWTSVGLLAAVICALPAAARARKLRGALWTALAAANLLQFLFGLAGLAAGRILPLADLPGVGPFGAWRFAADPLGSLLFVILGLIGAAAAVYAAGHARFRQPGTGLTFIGIVAAQYLFTSFLLTAQNGLPLLIAWEAMSLCAYAYVLVHHRERRVRQAAFVTLVASEFGFLLLVAAFVAAAAPGGSLALGQMQAALAQRPEAVRTAIFLLGLFGFGVKSGVLPMQLWMPSAYDAAPPHLNAILAGALLNLGLFGILRVYALTAPLPVPLGVAVVGLGAAGVFSGALFAVTAVRVRRVLAYSSIENVGFMVIALGLAISFGQTGALLFAGVALTALMVQMVSHALAKALCFLSMGEVSRRSDTADLDRLGGMWRTFPGAAAAFLVGALTLAAAAPFSGFVSEWLIFQAMFQAYRGLTGLEQAFIAVFGALAAIGAALAFTTFLRLFAFAFTGRARDEAALARAVRERASAVAVAGTWLLAAASAIYGFFPTAWLDGLNRAAALLPPHARVFRAMVPDVFLHPAANALLVSLGGTLFSFLPLPGAAVEPGAGVAIISPTYVLWWFLVFAACAFAVARALRRSPYRRRRVRAWMGGRALAAADAQYTAAAYANPYRMYWASLLRFRVRRLTVSGDANLPLSIAVDAQVSPWLRHDIYRPALRRARRVLTRIHHIQHGYLWGYLAVMLAALVVLLAWASLA